MWPFRLKCHAPGCGATVSPRARYCSQCGAVPAGSTATDRCWNCHHEISVTTKSCPMCKANVSDYNAAAIKSHSWICDDSVFAARIEEIHDIPGFFQKKLFIQPNTVARFIVDDQYSAPVPSGWYVLEDVFSRFLPLRKAETTRIVLAHAWDLELDFEIQEVLTNNPIALNVMISVTVEIKNLFHLDRNLLRDKPSITIDQLAALLQPEVRAAVAHLIGEHSIKQLDRDAGIRERLEAGIRAHLSQSMQRFGLEFGAVRTFEFSSPEWSRIKATEERYFISVTEHEVHNEGRRKLFDVITEQQLETLRQSGIRLQNEQKRSEIKMRIIQTQLDAKKAGLRGKSDFLKLKRQYDRENLLKDSEYDWLAKRVENLKQKQDLNDEYVIKALETDLAADLEIQRMRRVDEKQAEEARKRWQLEGEEMIHEIALADREHEADQARGERTAATEARIARERLLVQCEAIRKLAEIRLEFGEFIDCPAAESVPPSFPEEVDADPGVPFRLEVEEGVSYWEGESGYLKLRMTNKTAGPIKALRCVATCGRISLLPVRSSAKWIRDIQAGQRTREQWFEFAAEHARAGQYCLAITVEHETDSGEPLRYEALQHLHIHAGDLRKARTVDIRIESGGLIYAPGSGIWKDVRDGILHTRPGWRELPVHLDESLESERVEVSASAAPISVVVSPVSRSRNRPESVSDVAFLSWSDPDNVRQVITLCSRERITFGREQAVDGARPEDTSRPDWCVHVQPRSVHNDYLESHVSRDHGELLVTPEGPVVRASSGCRHGLHVDQGKLTKESPGPKTLQTGSVLEFPWSGIRYLCRAYHTKEASRHSLDASLSSLSHVDLLVQAAADAGVPKGTPFHDAVRFIPLVNKQQDGTPTRREQLLILTRRARIGNSSSNPIRVKGPGVEKFHAAIIRRGDSYLLQCLTHHARTTVEFLDEPSAAPIGLKFSQVVLLEGNARIRLGEMEVCLRFRIW
ncbi:SPFH domain-containing protein [Candidatus Eisenbacteria bacterium]|uniref:SPFH domain-containing protein n=1 Tax=Eiseniibacteriota bacterium TaxID=2212470 RepID=A0ABV6YK16_UNCEI